MSTETCVIKANTEEITADAGLTCPACGQGAALIPLGTRIDRPHRWRPWVVVATQLALCECCGALAATEAANQPQNMSWHPVVTAA